MRNNHSIKIKDKREKPKISKDKRYTKLKLKNNQPTNPNKTTTKEIFVRTGLKVSKRKRNIAAYHQYKAFDKAPLMFLAEALKNSETKKEKCDAAGWEESESLSWQFTPWYLQTMLPSLCIYSSKILIFRNTQLFQSCVTLEETETKLDLQL